MRLDGRPIEQLSASSYSKWAGCPEAWRRHYILGERPPTSGVLFLGSRVDDALAAYHRNVIEHGERLSPDQLLDVFRNGWMLPAAGRKMCAGMRSSASATPSYSAAVAVELALRSLIPHLGQPVEVQRRLEFTLAPGLEWSALPPGRRRSQMSASITTTRHAPGQLLGAAGEDRADGEPGERPLRAPAPERPCGLPTRRAGGAASGATAASVVCAEPFRR